MKKRFALSALAACIISGLVACTPASPASDRDAAAFMKDVRVCVTQASDVVFDIAPVKWTKGPAKTVTSKGALGCYENDNDKARTGVYFFFDTETITLFGRNYSVGTPDVVLCQHTNTFTGSSPDCADYSNFPKESNIYGLNTFGVNDSATMDALGHVFQVIRTANEGSFVVYNVVVKK